MIKTIGIGNRLMMDDGVAIAVLESVGSILQSIGIKVIIAETDFQFCFYQLEADDFVIFVDAACSGATAGSVHLYNLEEVVTFYKETNSHHEMNVFDLIRLHAKPIKGYLIGIEIAETGFGWELSETLKAKFDDICFKVVRTISEILKEVQNRITII